MNDPMLKKLIDWQARLDRMEARLDELEQLLAYYRARALAIKPDVPPPPPSLVN